MKKQLYALGATLLLAALNTTAQAQANDWIIPPSTVITFGSSGTVTSSLPPGAALGSCSASKADQITSVYSNGAGQGLAFVSNCGVYDLSGASQSSVKDYENVFTIPNQCGVFGSVQWENVHAAPSFNKLTFRTIAVSTVSQTSTTDLINDGSMHVGVCAAAGPMDNSSGTRSIYASSDLDLYRFDLDASGTVTATTIIATLPNTVDPRTGMEVSPDGTKILLSTGTTLYLYDIAAGSFTALGSFPVTVTIAGFEYVPMSSGDRVYFSYHYFNSGVTVCGLDYVTLTAPTTNVDAIPGVSTPTKYGYGFTDIERGKDGLLYFVFHNNYTSQTIAAGDVGTLVSMSTSASSPAIVYGPGGSAVQVQSLTQLGYVVQRQIDGEDYNIYFDKTPSFDVTPAKTASYSPIPEVYINNEVGLQLNATLYGPHDQVEVMVEEGSMSSSGGTLNFVPNTVQPANNTISYPGFDSHLSLNLVSYFFTCSGDHHWLENYRGPIRVSIRPVNSVCGPTLWAWTSKVYNLVDGVHFLLNSPEDNAGTRIGTPNPNPVCSSSPYLDPITVPATTLLPSLDGPQDRNAAVDDQAGDCGPRFGVFGTNPAHDNLLMDNTQAPGCEIGWLGASTAGIFQPPSAAYSNPHNVNIGTILSYGVVVQEFDQPGPGQALVYPPVTIINDLLTTNLSTGGIPTLPLRYNFDVQSGGYFTTNYASIAGARSNKVYEVTYTANGSTDTVSAISYFRILDDGVTSSPNPGGSQWRVANSKGDFRVSPNPAKDYLRFDWADNSETGSRTLIATNTLGQVVLRQSYKEEKGSNSLHLDLTSLAPGIYYYSMYANGLKQNGTFVKE
ncbi:MAG: T9SS type A sorting domain-containing protein [Bacteroidetes bacterium]|nr:T9SS type A sorting domain-containing protein [Bacteroidota bacterium]